MILGKLISEIGKNIIFTCICTVWEPDMYDAIVPDDGD